MALPTALPMACTDHGARQAQELNCLLTHTASVHLQNSLTLQVSSRVPSTFPSP